MKRCLKLAAAAVALIVSGPLAAQKGPNHIQYASCAAVAAMLAHSFSQPGADQDQKRAAIYKAEFRSLQATSLEMTKAVVGNAKAQAESNMLIMRMATYFIGNTSERFAPEARTCQQLKLVTPM